MDFCGFSLFLSPWSQPSDGHTRYPVRLSLWPQLKVGWSGGESPARLAAQLGDCCLQEKGMCQLSQICTCRRRPRPVRQHPAIRLLAGTQMLWVILQWGRHYSWRQTSLIPQAPSKNPKWASVSIGQIRGSPGTWCSQDLFFRDFEEPGITYA